MPIYEYICKACDDEFETLQRISDAPLNRCSHCGGRLERVPSRPSTNFNKYSGTSAERHSKMSIDQQARKERDRLVEHSKKTGVPLKDLFEDHEHN